MSVRVVWYWNSVRVVWYCARNTRGPLSPDRAVPHTTARSSRTGCAPLPDLQLRATPRTHQRGKPPKTSPGSAATRKTFPWGDTHTAKQKQIVVWYWTTPSPAPPRRRWPCSRPCLLHPSPANRAAPALPPSRSSPARRPSPPWPSSPALPPPPGPRGGPRRVIAGVGCHDHDRDALACHVESRPIDRASQKSPKVAKRGGASQSPARRPGGPAARAHLPLNPPVTSHNGIAKNLSLSHSPPIIVTKQ